MGLDALYDAVERALDQAFLLTEVVVIRDYYNQCLILRSASPDANGAGDNPYRQFPGQNLYKDIKYEIFDPSLDKIDPVTGAQSSPSFEKGCTDCDEI